MIRTLFLPALLLCAAAAEDKIPKPVPALGDLIRQRAEAKMRGDRAVYERQLTDNFVALTPTGQFLRKKEYLDDEFATRPEAVKTLAGAEDIKIVSNGVTATAWYTFVEESQYGRQRFTARMRRVDTYLLEGNRWRLFSMSAVNVARPPAPMKVSNEVLDQYSGTYELAPGVQSNVWREENQLVEQTTGQARVLLLPIADNVFADPADTPDARVTFERDGDGKVIAEVYFAAWQSIRARKIR